MRAIVIEDEKPSLELMKRLIEKTGILELSGLYTDPKKALDDFSRISPDVVFADIEMPLINGMELAHKIKNMDDSIQVVFVTAYEKYAVEAFRVNAVDYILKPITQDDLNITVNRLVKNYNCRKFSADASKSKSIVTFGNLAVYGANANQRVQWPTVKTGELFACFVMSKGEPLEKWQLCERLWPQSSPPKAEHNLHSAINRLKNSLQEAGIVNHITYEDGAYWMDTTGFRCDVWEFQRFIENNPLINGENISRYERILRSYKGDLFKTEDYLWCLQDREKLRALYLSAVKNIGWYFLKQRNFDSAEEYLRKAIEADPFDEEAVSIMLKLYFEKKDKKKLIDCYENLQTALRNDLGIVPNRQTSSFYNDLLRQM